MHAWASCRVLAMHSPSTSSQDKILTQMQKSTRWCNLSFKFMVSSHRPIRFCVFFACVCCFLPLSPPTCVFASIGASYRPQYNGFNGHSAEQCLPVRGVRQQNRILRHNCTDSACQSQGYYGQRQGCKVHFCARQQGGSSGLRLTGR